MDLKLCLGMDFFLYLPVYINMLPTLSNTDNKSQNCLKDNSVELNC